MASDRMMQAIGRLEQALGRLEALAAKAKSTDTAPILPVVDDAARTRAAAALQSLDSLIAELKVRG